VSERKRILVLGSTGSVGTSVLDVISHYPERFEVVGLAAKQNIRLLREQCARFPDARCAVVEADAFKRLVAGDAEMNRRGVGKGDNGIIGLIDEAGADLVVNCLVGFAGLRPTLHALAAGTDVALANKEAIVAGGSLIRDTRATSGAAVIPVDSEHVAISQCLRGCEKSDVKAIYITASGGALRDRPLDEIDRVTPGEVLAHPTWSMGDKITVDSATLLNKGLEVIEAHWLFELPYERIRVVIHPQSIVHSFVELKDNSILAQLSVPDMRLPILYALGYPERIETGMVESRITDFPPLTFAEVDGARYPCFALAMEAARRGGNLPTVLNSANEFAVGAFLAGRIRFTQIHAIISAALEGIERKDIRSFEDVFETDRATRAYAQMYAKERLER
jgi:1-deoxy-D-xylulose-5-phosphate reductoisomerase